MEGALVSYSKNECSKESKSSVYYLDCLDGVLETILAVIHDSRCLLYCAVQLWLIIFNCQNGQIV